MVLDEKSGKFWDVQGSSIFWWMYSLWLRHKADAKVLHNYQCGRDQDKWGCYLDEKIEGSFGNAF